VKAFGSGGRSSCFSPVHGDVFDHGAVVFEYANGLYPVPIPGITKLS